MWFDEAVSVFMSQLPAELLRETLELQDAVHGFYYFILSAWSDAVGPGLWQLRLLSALAMTAAVAGTVEILCQAGRPKTGLVAGLAMVMLPAVDRFATEARSYALVTALAVLASALLLRALDRPGPWLWVLYGFVLLAMSYLFIYSVLLGLGHLVTLAWIRPPKRVVVRFLTALAAVTLGITPLLFLAAQQRDQVEWLPYTRLGSWERIATTWTDLSSTPAALLLTLLVAAVVLAGLVKDRHSIVVKLALPWLLVPVGVLVAVSVFMPSFVGRYVVFSAPALAILLAIGLAAIKPRLLAVSVGVVMVLLAGWGSTLATQPDGFDYWAAKRAHLAAAAEEGDVVVFAPSAYVLVADADPSFDLDGVLRGDQVFPEGPIDPLSSELLNEHDPDRVWVVHKKEPTPEVSARIRSIMEESGMVLVDSQWVGNAPVDLYVRQ